MKKSTALKWAINLLMNTEDIPERFEAVSILMDEYQTGLVLEKYDETAKELKGNVSEVDMQ